MEPATVMSSPSESNFSTSEISASIFSAQDLETIAHNDIDQYPDGQLNANDISCETILPTFPIRHEVYREPITVSESDVMREIVPTSPSIVRENIQSSPKAAQRVNRNIAKSYVEHDISSQAEKLEAQLSQMTDDNNNPSTPIAVLPKQVDNAEISLSFDDNVVPMQVDVDNNIPEQSDNDIRSGIVLPASPFAAEIPHSTPKVDDMIQQLPVKLEPVDINPTLMEVSHSTVVIGKKRKRRSAPKKRKNTLCIDDVIMLDSDEMGERIQNITIDCKRPRTDIISKAERLSREEVGFFTEPTMYGQCNRKLFKQNLISNNEENDLSIIHAILNIPKDEQPESVENRGQESQIIEGDMIRRRSSRKRKSPDVHPRVSQEPKIPNVEDLALPTPIENVMNEIDSQLAVNSFEIDVPFPDVQPVDQQPRDKMPAQALITLNVNDEQVLRKLKMLWKQNVHPITMANITSHKSNRLQAAMNFASILGKFNHCFESFEFID